MTTLLTSSPATLSVTSFPYSLPASGQAALIGANIAADVRPATHNVYEWNYALFFFYGGGTFVEDYSAGGAYVIAGSGGHAVPPNFGGCLFDFADATWKRIDNANGMPWIKRDLNAPGFSGEINSFGEINWPGVSSGIPGGGAAGATAPGWSVSGRNRMLASGRPTSVSASVSTTE